MFLMNGYSPTSFFFQRALTWAAYLLISLVLLFIYFSISTSDFCRLLTDYFWVHKFIHPSIFFLLTTRYSGFGWGIPEQCHRWMQVQLCLCFSIWSMTLACACTRGRRGDKFLKPTFSFLVNYQKRVEKRTPSPRCGMPAQHILQLFVKGS